MEIYGCLWNGKGCENYRKTGLYRVMERYKNRYSDFPVDEKPFLILEPEKPGNKGKFVVVLLPEWRFYLKFISIQ